jgi:3D (Asp-Asp-Asp) domain-containing protein
VLLTLGDIISKSTTFAGRSDWSASEVSFYANLALTEVANRLHHKPKEATALSNVTGTGDERRIAVPQDFDSVVALKFYSTSTDADTGANILGEEIDLPIVDTTILDSFSSTSGQPARFALYAGFIEVDPIPDSRGSFVLRYTAKQPTLLLSTETPSLDERWHPGWLWKTAELVNLSRGNAAGASDCERRYVNYMVSTPNDRSTEQSAKHGLGLTVKRSS